MKWGDDMETLSFDKYTDSLYGSACCGMPVNPQTAEDVAEGIRLAIELDGQPLFLEGVAERLTELGIPCTESDTEIMLTEIKQRYRDILGKSCPRTVKEWLKGTTPGVTNRINHYDLCYALEMDFQQTAIFFQKHFLSLPFNVKSKADAIFLYCLYHKKPYQTAMQMLQTAEEFVTQENAHTSTAQLFTTITAFEDDAEFLHYLSSHCYGNEQQFQLARSIINAEIKNIKERIRHDGALELLSPDKLNSETIAHLLGYKYQSIDKKAQVRTLPKRFTESLPNDVTLGRIINGDSISYETLRKTLMLLKFYSFYADAEEYDRNEIMRNLMDFSEALNDTLISCGFAQIYVRHPFDCLLLYCANSYDPILTMHLLCERN